MALPTAAGLLSFVVATGAGLLGPVGLLISWLGPAVATGLLLRAAGDWRATRAMVAMMVLVPVVWVLQVLVLPLAAAGAWWLADVLGLATLVASPSVALAFVGSNRRPEPPIAPFSSTPGLRIGLAACMAAVVAAGHLSVQLRSGRLDEGFFILLFFDLVPAIVFAAAVRRPTTTLVTGFLVFAVVSGGWALFKFEDGNQFAGVWVFFSWILGLAVATAGALRDMAAPQPLPSSDRLEGQTQPVLSGVDQRGL